MKAGNRWVIAIAGVFLQIALGAVYAWSVFRIPLSKQFGWSISEVTFTFTISIFVLGFAAFFGGLWMNKKGPRIVALTGATLYGLGVFLASFSANKLWWLYLSYGFIGGLGLGFGYIVPVAVLVKWFPDRRGLITGIAVGGFGAGALITAPVASRLISARRLAARGLDAYVKRSVAASCARFRSPRSAQDLAMVGALVNSVSQYLSRHRCDFPGSSNISGADRSHGSGRWWDGWSRQPR